MKTKGLLKALGPGILFASTAIGVSHLVQSTRAGAGFGFGLIGIVVLANVVKYPFFEYGSRYANITGKSIISGYRETGKWALYLYLVITLSSMFFVAAAVGVVTAGFLDNLFGIGSLRTVTIVLFALCVVILMIGRYRLLDSLIKVIAAVLLLSTLLAFVLTLGHGRESTAPLFPEMDWLSNLGFIIALMGWMPTAVDLSAWNSLWTLERIKQTGYHPELRETLFDFNMGYIISGVLSLVFVTLGAYLIYGTGSSMPDGSAAFANSVVGLYTATIGDWSCWIIATAAFSIMFGTCIAVFDGYARSVDEALLHLRNEVRPDERKKLYPVTLMITGIGAFGLIYYMLFFQSNSAGFKRLVDLATTISFVIAPVIAALNFYLVMNRRFPRENRPPAWMRALSYFGILFLFGFSVFYLFAD
ncbi:MAG: divalent metal cation transporter [Flavobacteriales bacterium]|nr:divalent metal cation transporter [Flavobacteriales bacterium]